MEKDNLIGLVFATLMEAAPFVNGLSLSLIEEKPFSIYSNEKILLVISGIGKANAAIATSYLTWKYDSRCMFNIGASGATRNNRNVGDIFHIDSVIEYDRPRISDGKMRIKKPDLLEGFDTTSLATQDHAILSSTERETISEFADLVDMEGASFIHACRLFMVKCYLFKIVSDTPEHNTGLEIMENIKLIGDSLYEFFQENILNNKEMQIFLNI